MNQALLIVDVQRDFCPGGALPAAGGDAVVPVINRLMDHFDYIVASKDWHPLKTVHFEKWPPHCIRGTSGADFHPDLEERKIDALALKGTGNSDDGYSAFEATNLDLVHRLRKNNMRAVYVVGIATDYCVKASALDALKAGFEVFVVTDAIAAVNQLPDDGEKALRMMKEAGVRLITSAHISG